MRDGTMERGRKTGYRIGKVVRLLKEEYPDLTASSLRFWQREGLLEPSLSSKGGQRRYTEYDLHKIRAIRELANSRLSIEEIKVWFKEHAKDLEAPTFPLLSMHLLPWMVRCLRRRTELEMEARRFMALDYRLRRRPLHGRELLLISAGDVSLSLTMRLHFRSSQVDRRGPLFEVRDVEKSKKALLSQLEALKILRPENERNRQGKVGPMYSEVDRLIFMLAFFLGKNGASFQGARKGCSFHEAVGIYPQFPWKDAQGRVLLENVLFNLVVDQITEQFGGPLMQAIKRQQIEGELPREEPHSPLRFLDRLNEALQGKGR
jgi:DNA-binding transcriptional MerR regulator